MPLTFGPPSKGWPNFTGPHIGRTYIAGPMRGYERFNFPAFDAAQKVLEAEGWEVISPAQMDRNLHGDEIEFTPVSEIDAAWMHSAMRRDIAVLIDPRHTAIHLLEGWENSSGANVELTVARAVGLEVYEQVDSSWIRRA